MKRLLLTKIGISLLAGAAPFAVEAAPGVVVGIVVDQLRTDYLDKLRPLFGEGGFNRLMSEGVFFKDVDFKNTVSDAASGAAVIYTGAWPVANGVASAEVYDEAAKTTVPVLAKGSSRYAPEYTPENLPVSTIADEFYVDGAGLTKIFSVAADPQVAVIAAGHAGNAAIWFDESKGRWATPKYYTGVPAVVSNQIRSTALASKVQSSSWQPKLPLSSYPISAENPSLLDFRYSFAGSGREAYEKYKESALFNEDVTAISLDLLKMMGGSAGNGQRGMLNVAYSLAPYSFDYDGDSRPELVDSYLRLDTEIARLIDAVYAAYGRENAVIFLASTGYADEPEINLRNARIPTGEVTLKKVESLLNSYLSATYGNGDYVALISDGKLYLDNALIEKKGINRSEFRLAVKQFLLKMSGVSEVFTIDDLYRGGNSRLEEMALGIDMKSSPDLFLLFTPGWTVVDDNVYPEKRSKVRLSSPCTPMFILSPESLPAVVETPLPATKLAPTISSMIHIRAPNGAAEKPYYTK